MATKMRRLTIYLPAELDDALSNLSHASLQSRPRLARMFLQEAVPSINELAEVMTAARENDPDVIRRFRKLMTRLRKEVRTGTCLELIDGGDGD
jgi:hypothetical protein